MALFEDIFEGWASGGLLGVGMIIAAPTIIPLAGALVRPIARGLGEGFLVITDAVRGAVGVAGEGMRQVSEGLESVGAGAEEEGANGAERRAARARSRAKMKNELRPSKPRNRSRRVHATAAQKVAA
jgi:hypothetical protein